MATATYWKVEGEKMRLKSYQDALARTSDVKEKKELERLIKNTERYIKELKSWW